MLQALFEAHNREMVEVKNGIQEYGVKLKEISAIRRVILDFK